MYARLKNLVLVGLALLSSLLTSASITRAQSGCGTTGGPNGIYAGRFEPTLLTQQERDWLYHVFGNSGSASEGFGGETCPGQNGDQRINAFHMRCNTHRNDRGPGGIQIGAYPDTSLDTGQRDWLWDIFYPNDRSAELSTGWSGEFCPWQSTYNPPPANNSSGPNPQTGGGGGSGNDRQGMNLNAFCQSIGYAGVDRTRDDAHSWLCRDGSNNYHPFDMNAVCAWQYGGANPHVSLGSDSDSGSWACNSQSQSSPANGTWTYISGGQSTSGDQSSGGSSTPRNNIGGSSSRPSGQYAYVRVGDLYVRNGPGTNYNAIGYAVQGNYYAITEVSGQWGHFSGG